MNHSELQEKLFDWHDGQLSAAQAAEVSIHLPGCSECRMQLDEWKHTAQTFLIPLKMEDSPAFTQNVLRKIRNTQAAETQERPRFFARWAFPALALSMGSFAAVLLYVAQPPMASADGLLLTDSQDTPSEWVSSLAKEDQILGSVVENP